MQLWPEIPVRRVVLGDAVPVENASEARFALDEQGERWICKPLAGVDTVLAEAVSLLLGRALGVKMPEGAVTFDDDKMPCWLSKLVPNVRSHWDARRAMAIENLDEVGHMLTLDTIVGNEDRHDQNVLLTPGKSAGLFVCWAIDHGNAWIGSPADLLRRGVACPSPARHFRGLPLPGLVDSARSAASVAHALSEDELYKIARVSCLALAEPSRADTPENVDAVYQSLLLRCRRAPDLIEEYLILLGAQS